MRRMAGITIALVLAALGVAPVGAQEHYCLPSCDGSDGRLIGTTGDFNNFVILSDPIPPFRVQVLRFWVEAGEPLTVEVFDGDPYGRNTGQNWDADYDTNGNPSLVPLDFTVCPDLDEDFVCDSSGTTVQGTSMADNDWSLVETVAADGAERFFLLIISVNTSDPTICPEVPAEGAERVSCILSKGWNMYKVRVNKPNTILVPAYVDADGCGTSLPQILGYGVPINSCSDFEILYPNSDCASGIYDFSDSTYDGTFRFNLLNYPAPGACGTAERFVLWDGDMDRGTADDGLGRIFDDGSRGICLDEENVAIFDQNDPDTEDGVVPSFLANAGITADVFANQLGGLTEQGGHRGLFIGGCFGSGFPPDDWPNDTGLFVRAPDFGENITYQVADRQNRIFRNFDPSANQEFEKFEISATADCVDDVSSPLVNADYCLNPAEGLESGVYELKISGQDVLNINHIHASVCVGGSNADCIPLLCRDGKKPKHLRVEYIATPCPLDSSDPTIDTGNVQTADTCDPAGGPTVLPASARIVARKPGNNGNVWYDSAVDPSGGDGLISVGESFVISNRTPFSGGNLVIEIFEPGGGTPVQTMEFHVSCSQPIRIGDVFGSIRILDGFGQGQE